MDVLSLYKIKAIHSSNRLELLAVLSRSQASEKWCLPFGIFLLSWDILHSNMMLHGISEEAAKKTCMGFSARQTITLENKFFDSSKWDEQAMSEDTYLFQGMSLKNPHRKMMLKWVFISIELFKSLLLQNLLANSTRHFDIINTSWATGKTQILNTCSTSEIKPNKAAVLLNTSVQLRSHKLWISYVTDLNALKGNKTLLGTPWVQCVTGHT